MKTKITSNIDENILFFISYLLLDKQIKYTDCDSKKKNIKKNDRMLLYKSTV